VTEKPKNKVKGRFHTIIGHPFMTHETEALLLTKKKEYSLEVVVDHNYLVLLRNNKIQ